MVQSPTPVFVFSLPRSGSTLLQKILAAHPRVATSSEPWILLPLIMARRPGAAYAIYRHEDAVRAMDEFSRSLVGGRAAFDRALHDFVIDLYRRASPGDVSYFVDKTPRYHLIADEVIHLFPEAKFIFLWRNPLSVAASMIRTWGSGHWNLFRHRVDLEIGLPHLVETYRAHKSEVVAVRYEDLVEEPVSVTERVFRYLDLDFRAEVLQEFADVTLRGGMGDTTGIMYGAKISQSSTDAWPTVVTSSLRKAWLRRYIDTIGKDALATMGYERDSLLESLRAVDTSNRTLADDVLRMAYGVGYRNFDRLVEWRSRRYLRNTRGHVPEVNSCVRMPERTDPSLGR